MSSWLKHLRNIQQAPVVVPYDKQTLIQNFYTECQKSGFSCIATVEDNKFFIADEWNLENLGFVDLTGDYEIDFRRTTTLIP